MVSIIKMRCATKSAFRDVLIKDIKDATMDDAEKGKFPSLAWMNSYEGTYNLFVVVVFVVVVVVVVVVVAMLLIVDEIILLSWQQQ